MSGELAVVYAALILADDKIPVTADKLSKLTAAANVKVESYWFDLFANALGGKDINELLLSASTASAAPAPAAAAGPAAGAAPAKKEEKEEPKEEEEVRLSLSLSPLALSARSLTAALTFSSS
jgi:large subunit ribosomal protein LP1